MSTPVGVRCAVLTDLEAVAFTFRALWPEGSLADHREEAAAILSGTPPSTLPLVVFVAEKDAKVVGFIEVGLRKGCGARPDARSGGLGTLARLPRDSSDTWLDSEPSQRAHEALAWLVSRSSWRASRARA